MSILDIVNKISANYIIELATDFYHDMKTIVYRVDLMYPDYDGVEPYKTFYGEPEETLDELFIRIKHLLTD